MEMDNKIIVFFTPANTTSFLQPVDQEVILTLIYYYHYFKFMFIFILIVFIIFKFIMKSYYLRNTFRETVAATDSDSSDGSGHSKLKTLWEGFTILDAIKSTFGSWEEVKYLYSLELE